LKRIAYLTERGRDLLLHIKKEVLKPRYTRDFIAY